MNLVVANTDLTNITKNQKGDECHDTILQNSLFMEQNKYYVYAFYNNDWKDYFYIGKGSGDRYKNFENRSNHVRAIINAHSISSEILVSGLSEEEAYLVETELKEKYIQKGSPIIDYEGYKKRNQRRGIAAMPIIDGKRVSPKTGNATGRPSAEFPEEWKKYFTEWKSNRITANKFMDDLKLKRTTFYKLVKIYENNI